MEHRLYKRYALKLALTLWQAGKKISATNTQCIGVGGVSISNAQDRLSVGQIVMLDFSGNADMNGIGRLRALVVHSTGGVAGLMFEQRLPKSLFLHGGDDVAANA